MTENIPENENNPLLLKNQLCFPLYAAARQITGLYAPVLKPLGITYTQYLVFLVLWEEDGLRVSDLGDRLFLDSGTLTPLLKKLEEKGLISRRRSGDDERVVRVFLTDKGCALRKKAESVPMTVGSCVSLPAEDARELYRILYSLLGK